jgi:outer membrane protein TolC
MTNAAAFDLMELYGKAQGFDPAFLAAKADRAVSGADITVLRLSYLPTANVSFGRETTDNRNRTTVQVSQPVLDLQKFASMREASPREVQAESTFRGKEGELAQKVLKVVLEMVKTRETIELNTKQVEALSQQLERSQRRFDLGQGTITEVRTAQVRLDQAQASRRQLLAQAAIVDKQFAALIGEPVPRSPIAFSKAPSLPRMGNLEALLGRVLEANPNVLAARAGERVAELEQQKVVAGYLPQVTAVSRSTKVAGEASQNYSGLQLSIPLGVSASNFASSYKAALGVDRAKELVRGSEQGQRLEAERLWALVNAGIEELAIRKSAIENAQLSAEANVKSYEAGVVTAVDVLNAILAVFETERDYLNALATLAENHLSLQLVSAETPIDALRSVQAVLLPK